jgi:hypothetical protein
LGLGEAVFALHDLLQVSPNTQRRPLADTSKAATEGQVGSLVEEGSTSVAKKLGQQ